AVRRRAGGDERKISLDEPPLGEKAPVRDAVDPDDGVEAERRDPRASLVLDQRPGLRPRDVEGAARSDARGDEEGEDLDQDEDEDAEDAEDDRHPAGGDDEARGPVGEEPRA